MRLCRLCWCGYSAALSVVRAPIRRRGVSTTRQRKGEPMAKQLVAVVAEKLVMWLASETSAAMLFAICFSTVLAQADPCITCGAVGEGDVSLTHVEQDAECTFSQGHWKNHYEGNPRDSQNVPWPVP